MRIGYACLTVGVQNTDIRTCAQKNASEEKLKELISHNLTSLENIIDYNIKNDILLFRISSDLIPFGSSPVNRIPWWDLFRHRLQVIGEKIKSHGMRVSMHPGQYTVINSPHEDVVERSITDLDYHARVLESLNLNREHKIILHIGGIYGDKGQAIRRFEKSYKKLAEPVKERLVIENDDRSYTISDVLEIGTKMGIPVVFDNLHHRVNPSLEKETDAFLINACKNTWKKEDGPPKIHYSQQDRTKKPGAHSSTIKIDEFLRYMDNLGEMAPDLMLEVKDKNLSALKCVNCMGKDKRILVLEREWGRYKYSVLEKAPAAYQEVRNLLKDKDQYPALDFYHILEEALNQPEAPGNTENAALHVFGYFKELATIKEKDRFFRLLDSYKQGKIHSRSMKNLLWMLTQKYGQPYLLDSLYFIL